MNNVNLSGRFKSSRVLWTDLELKIVLGYYFFIYENNTREKDYELFASDLRKMTGNNRSNGSVGVRFGNFISVDPSKSSRGFKGGDTKCVPIWEECINSDRTPKEKFIKLFMQFVEEYGNRKSIYYPFLKKYSHYRSLNIIDEDDEEGIITTNDIIDSEEYKPSYIPEKKPNISESINKKYQRNSLKSKNAIKYSGYKCSINPNHESFISKNGKKYMEAHHIIPISIQEDFNNSLDVDANIVSLCPLCHRKLHHGNDIIDDLKKLYDERIENLRQSGIDISFEELLKLYK
jgi:5-methylcytosine-specific restriction endonuclease McrA